MMKVCARSYSIRIAVSPPSLQLFLRSVTTRPHCFSPVIDLSSVLHRNG